MPICVRVGEPICAGDGSACDNDSVSGAPGDLVHVVARGFALTFAMDKKSIALCENPNERVIT